MGGDGSIEGDKVKGTKGEHSGARKEVDEAIEKLSEWKNELHELRELASVVL